MDNAKDFLIYRFPVILLFNAVIILAGYAAARFFGGRQALQRKGLPEEYSVLAENQLGRWGAFVWGVLGGVQVIGIILSLLLGYPITFEFYFSIIFTAAVILLLTVIVFARPLLRTFGKEYKELAIAANKDIVIDFNYRILNRVMNMKLELPALLLACYFNIRFFDNSTALYICMFIPWIYYLGLRRSAYNIYETLGYNYLLLTGFIIFFQTCRVFVYVAVLIQANSLRQIWEFILS